MDSPLKIQNKGNPCQNAQCERLAFALGYCKNCYNKVSQFGDPNFGKSRGSYRRKSKINSAGYVTWYDPESIHANNSGWVLEHRYLYGELLGRRLLPHENVHHKNGDRSDNRIQNLELWSKKQPPGQRIQDKLAWAYEIIELYGKVEF